MLTAVRPRPVLCLNEHEHRDRALADDVADGVFAFAGETRELGLEPDWLRAPSCPPTRSGGSTG